MDDSAASRTALVVCQGRAVAQGRVAPDRFDDPVAFEMLRPAEREAVEVARSDTPPNGWSNRLGYEMLRSSGEVMVPRTIAIDDGLRERLARQVVILGAGLDDRAWRMPELRDRRDVVVFEVDHPATQSDKRDRVAELAALAGDLRFVPVDFAHDSLAAALDAAGHEADQPTTWLWEGVVPYLTAAEVRTTLRAVAARSAPGSRLVVNYQSPSVAAYAGRVAAQVMTTLSRQANPWRGEPRRSAWRPEAFAALLGEVGFRVVRDEDLVAIAEGIGMTIRNRRSLASGRVAVADRV